MNLNKKNLVLNCYKNKMAEKVFPIVQPAHFSFLASLKEMLGV